MRRSVRTALLLLLALAFAIACSEEPATGPTAEDYRAERERLLAQMKKSKGRAKPAPEAPAASQDEVADQGGFGVVASTYSYDPRGKRDPFSTFQHNAGPVTAALSTPLMNYELEQLAVVAVIWDSKKPRALVADPRGENYVVKEGSPIGKNDGLVIHIGDNMVLVKETYVDFAGEMTTKDVELRIRRSQGG